MLKLPTQNQMDDNEIVIVNSGDLNADNKKNQVYRRKETMKDTRNAMEKYIDRFWTINVNRVEKEKDRELKVAELDQIVHDFIH